jgi:type IV pilus assembly protein PilQ
VTEFVRLNYARAVGTLAQAAGSTAGYAGGSTNSSSAAASVAMRLVAAAIRASAIIKRRLSRRGAFEVDGRSNTLIITDVKRNIEAVRQLVAILDQPEPQVEIETRVSSRSKLQPRPRCAVDDDCARRYRSS